MKQGFVIRLSVIVLVTVFCYAGKTAGSAIPMWEFLTRDEKMSHLYGTFIRQVAEYCSTSPLPDCNKNLLVNGVASLANMNDNQLDRLDPYQRGAKDTIWRAMIGEKRLIQSKNFHDDAYYNADPMATSENDNNGLTEDSETTNDYARPSDHAGPYLVGPMVIRVFPDGRPVPGDAERPLPRDEDVEELDYPKLPAIDDIRAVNRGRYHTENTRSPVTANRRNVYNNRDKFVQRSHNRSNIDNHHYRRVNTIFRERRLSNGPRPVFRYY